MADGGIEYILELTAKLDAATQMVKKLSQVEAAALKTDAALKRAEKHTGMLGSVMKKTGGAFQSVGKTMLGNLGAMATFAGLQRLGRAFMDIGGEALMAAGEAERTRKSFELMMGVKPAGDLLDYLDRLAGKTEFTDGAWKGFAAELMQAGLEGDDLKRSLAGVADIAAMSGNKVEGAGKAVGLLSKIQMGGSVSKRDLMGAKLDVNKYYAALSEQTGIGVKGIAKKLAAGKISAEVQREALFKVITDKTGKDLGGAGVGMSMTFLAQFEKAKDIIPNLFEDLEKSGGLKGITAGLAKLVTMLSPDSPGGRKIIAGLTQMLDNFGKLIQEIDFDEWSDRLVHAIDIFSGLVQGAAILGGAFGTLFGWFTSLGELIGDVAYIFVDLNVKFFEAAWQLGTSIWQGIVEGISKGIQWVVSTVEGMGQAIKDKVKGILGIHSPSAVFAGFGAMTALGFSQGIEGAMPSVAATMAGAFAPPVLAPAMTALPAVAALGGAALASASAPMMAGGGGGGAGPMLQADITINIGAQPGREGESRAVAEQSYIAVRQALESVLSQLAAEGGAL